MVEKLFDTLLSSLLSVPRNESRRLLHGRGGTVDGLHDYTADLYGPLLLLVVYRGTEREERDSLLGMLSLLLETACRRGCRLEGAALQERTLSDAGILGFVGTVPQSLVCTEEGLRYRIEPFRGQNPGLFLDMRPGREFVRNSSAGARVLNLFAYTCAGGAAEVINLDMKSPVLSRGRENHRLNFGDQPQTRVRYLALDLMKSFSKIDRLGLFDRVIVDPPSHQGRSFSYMRHYAKVLRRARNWLAPDGLIITCLNAPDAPDGWLKEQVEREFPELELVQEIEKGADFPEKEPSLRRIALVWRMRKELLDAG